MAEGSFETLLGNPSTVQIPFATDDIFGDICWPEDQDITNIDESQCLDCLLHPSSACGSCVSEVSPRNDLTPHSTDGANHTTPSSQQTSSGVDLSPESNGTTMVESQTGARFSKEIKSILRLWYNEHKASPYPSTAEKDDLAARTGLSRGQVSLWLANTRRRHRARKVVQAQAVPEVPFESMNPFDRWKVTPLEEEYSTQFVDTNIRPVALNSTPPPQFLEPSGVVSYAPSQFAPEQSTTTIFDNFYNQTMVSYDTEMTSLIDGTSISDTTYLSYGVSNQSVTSKGARDRRRRRHQVTKSSNKPTKDRSFQCTFCLAASFATKYDWQRHEKSQHLSLEKWTCCLSGGIMYTNLGPTCAFCGDANPDVQHLELHHYSACQDKSDEERTFYRKDHFNQHLRLTHETKYNANMDLWKSEHTSIKSRCGFCNAQFSSWSQRADHLASHFKCHYDMKDWKGDLGFEPHIANLVEKCDRQYSIQTLAQQFALPGLPKSWSSSSTEPEKLVPMLDAETMDYHAAISTASTLGNASWFEEPAW